MQVKIKKLSENAYIPTKATEGSGAYDLYCPKDTMVSPNGRTLIPLDIALELPKGYVADIRPRSGYSLKGFADANDTRHNADVLLGTIDSDYRGNIGVVVLTNREYQGFLVRKGQRIAQMLVHKAEDVDFVPSDTLSETERGCGGFSSTGN